MKNVFALSVLMVLCSSSAFAETSGTTTAKQTSVIDNIGFTYTADVNGGTFRHADGNDGKGIGFGIRHYLSPKYRFKDGVSLTLTQLVTQKLDRDGSGGMPTDRFSFFLPYLTLSKGNLLSKSAPISMFAYARYYIPIGGDDKARGSATDSTFGRARVRLYPTYQITKKLSATVMVGYQHYLAGSPTLSSFQHEVYISPSLSLQVTKSFSVGAEFFTLARGTHGGKWGKYFKNQDANLQLLEFTANYTGIKRLTVTPYVDLYPGREGKDFFADGSFGMAIAYSAL